MSLLIIKPPYSHPFSSHRSVLNEVLNLSSPHVIHTRMKTVVLQVLSYQAHKLHSPRSHTRPRQRGTSEEMESDAPSLLSRSVCIHQCVAKLRGMDWGWWRGRGGQGTRIVCQLGGGRGYTHCVPLLVARRSRARRAQISRDIFAFICTSKASPCPTLNPTLQDSVRPRICLVSHHCLFFSFHCLRLDLPPLCSLYRRLFFFFSPILYQAIFEPSETLSGWGEGGLWRRQLKKKYARLIQILKPPVEDILLKGGHYRERMLC